MNKLSYDAGYRDGLAAFAHWKDGVQRVGTGGTTLEHAQQNIESLWSYKLRGFTELDAGLPNPDLCPPGIVESLLLYQNHGIPTGDFLRAVIENKLLEAVGRADDQNLRALPHICAWVYNRLRAPHGSEAAYNEHLEAMRAKKERQA